MSRICNSLFQIFAILLISLTIQFAWGSNLVLVSSNLGNRLSVYNGSSFKNAFLVPGIMFAAQDKISENVYTITLNTENDTYLFSAYDKDFLKTGDYTKRIYSVNLGYDRVKDLLANKNMLYIITTRSIVTITRKEDERKQVFFSKTISYVEPTLENTIISAAVVPPHNIAILKAQNLNNGYSKLKFDIYAEDDANKLLHLDSIYTFNIKTGDVFRSKVVVNKPDAKFLYILMPNQILVFHGQPGNDEISWSGYYHTPTEIDVGFDHDPLKGAGNFVDMLSVSSLGNVNNSFVYLYSDSPHNSEVSIYCIGPENEYILSPIGSGIVFSNSGYLPGLWLGLDRDVATIYTSSNQTSTMLHNTINLFSGRFDFPVFIENKGNTVGYYPRIYVSY